MNHNFNRPACRSFSEDRLTKQDRWVIAFIYSVVTLVELTAFGISALIK